MYSVLFSILVQCPHFTALYPKEFSTLGRVTLTVREFSATTINILLHYFHSGELLHYWCADEFIIEFCKAVDLYQLKEMVEMIDKYLSSVSKNRNFLDAWELLKLSRKFCLKNSEKRLTEIIMSTVKSVKSSDELVSFLCAPYDTNNTLEQISY